MVLADLKTRIVKVVEMLDSAVTNQVMTQTQADIILNCVITAMLAREAIEDDVE